MTGHAVITGGWLARTADGATWDGYRVAQLDPSDVFTYAGPAHEYRAIRGMVDTLETSGRVVWWANTPRRTGSTETHWTAQIHAAGLDWECRVTPGIPITGGTADGYSFTVATPDGPRPMIGTADTLHGAMTDAVATVMAAGMLTTD